MGATQVFSKAAARYRTGAPQDGTGTYKRLIDDVDYVISVSGGGYTAGARLLAVQPSYGERHLRSLPRLSERFQQGSPEFDHFRRNSSYIADSPVELIRALVVVLRNLVGSLSMLFAVPAIIGWTLGYLLALPYFSLTAFRPVEIPAKTADNKLTCPIAISALTNHSASWLAVAVFLAFAMLFAMLALVVECIPLNRLSALAWELFLRLARGSLWFGLLILLIVALLPGLMLFCSTIGLSDARDAGARVAAIATGVVGLNYAATIATIAWRKRETVPVADLAKLSRLKKLLPAGVVQLCLTLLTFAVLMVVWLVTLGSFAASTFGQMALRECGANDQGVQGKWLIIGSLVAVIFLGIADVTSLSLHPFYRRRLKHTFAVRRVRHAYGDEASGAERYPENEWTWLAKYGRVPIGGPKFLFAAAATLDGEANPAPGLNAVSYVLSHDYIGGPALGWLKTKRLFDAAPPRLKRDLTVQASMAISGAAFASAMGRMDKGFEKLLAVSGARLGTWLPNPKFVGELVDANNNGRPWPKLLPIIRGAGYFYRELFGINYDDARLVQVTDGGHYENLGLVEALRRRCQLIFCIDGGGGSPPLLSGLSEAMRLAKYELGITISLDADGPYAVDNVAPGSGRRFPEGHALASLNGRLSKGAVVAGRIHYPPAACFDEKLNGVLIYAKAVLCEACPDWLLTYAASSPVFPHDPTSDQWFNEAQFAAYTTLGRIMGKQAMDCAEALQAGRVI